MLKIKAQKNQQDLKNQMIAKVTMWQRELDRMSDDLATFGNMPASEKAKEITQKLFALETDISSQYTGKPIQHDPDQGFGFTTGLNDGMG